ncbi:MAG: hypothetical protein ABL957_01385 [Parvularculaceae bacterium]
MSDSPPKKRAPDDECLGWAISRRRKCELTISAARLKTGCITCNTHKEYEKALQKHFDIGAYQKDNSYHRAFFKKHFPELFEPPESAVHVRFPPQPVRIELSLPPSQRAAPQTVAKNLVRGLTDTSDKRPGLAELAAISAIIGVTLATLSAIGNWLVYAGLGFNYFTHATYADHVAATFEMSPWIICGVIVWVLWLLDRASTALRDAKANKEDTARVYKAKIAEIKKSMDPLKKRISLLLLGQAATRALSKNSSKIDNKINSRVAALAAEEQQLTDADDAARKELSAADQIVREREDDLHHGKFLDFFTTLFEPSGPSRAFWIMFIAIFSGCAIKYVYLAAQEPAYLVEADGVPRDQKFAVVARLQSVFFLRSERKLAGAGGPSEVVTSKTIPVTEDKEWMRRIVRADLVNQIFEAGLEEQPPPTAAGGQSITSFFVQSGEPASPATPSGFGLTSFFYFVDGEPVSFPEGTIPLPLFPTSVDAQLIDDKATREAFGGVVDTAADAYAFGAMFLSDLTYTTLGYDETAERDSDRAAGRAPAERLDYLNQVAKQLQSCRTAQSPLKIDVMGFASRDNFHDDDRKKLHNSDALNHALAEGRRATILTKLGFELSSSIPAEITAGAASTTSILSKFKTLELVGENDASVSRLPMNLDLPVAELAKRLKEMPSKLVATNVAATGEPSRFGFRFASHEEMKKARDGLRGEGADPSKVQSLLSRSVVIRVLPGQRCVNASQPGSATSGN